jgi:hypothetical protein
MPLTPRQELAYNHTADFYQPAQAIAADGKIGPTTYTKHAGVRCRWEIRASPTAPSAMGRVESDIVVAIDLIHVAEDQAIDDGWWLLNLSLLPDGSQSTLYGRWAVVRGEPQRFIDSARRRGGRKIVFASQEPAPPDGLPL